MLITKEQQEALIDNFLKDAPSPEEFAGFCDGVKAAIDLIDRLNKPKHADAKDFNTKLPM